MTEDPIQRAAEALARNARFADPEAWRRYVDTVRIVLEAVDAPTSTMIDAGNLAMRASWAKRGLAAPDVGGDAAVAAAWEAMLDRLLQHT